MTQIEKLEEILTNFGGYVLIPSEKRQTFELYDGIDDYKKTEIKSVVSVCENSSGTAECLIRVRVTDKDDIQWDAEEYMDADDLERLVKICEVL